MSDPLGVRQAHRTSTDERYAKKLEVTTAAVDDFRAPTMYGRGVQSPHSAVGEHLGPAAVVSGEIDDSTNNVLYVD